jgi:hypothetical protein
MSPRALALLMLLFCSAIAGASYARRGAAPPDLPMPEVAEMHRAAPAVDPQETKPEARIEPAIRVILRSPYEIRSN